MTGLRVTVGDGKYEITQHEDGSLTAWRNGLAWRDLTGDKLVLALAQEVERLRRPAVTLEMVRVLQNRLSRDHRIVLSAERAKEALEIALAGLRDEAGEAEDFEAKVERVAKALFGRRHRIEHWPEFHDCVRDDYRDDARAALDAAGVKS